MRALILVAGAALTLSACGGGAEPAAETNDTMGVENLQVENLVINDTTGLDATTNMDGNMATDMNMMENGLETDLNVEANAEAGL